MELMIVMLQVLWRLAKEFLQLEDSEEQKLWKSSTMRMKFGEKYKTDSSNKTDLKLWLNRFKKDASFYNLKIICYILKMVKLFSTFIFIKS